MNMAAYHRQRKALAAAQADYDHQCPTEWPEEKDDLIETEEDEK
jgi:hypothetical protein